MAPASPDGAPIALVSCRAYPRLSPDDRLLDAALRRLGWRTVTAIWDDPRERWQAYRAIVLRSCWDYHRRPQAFRRWLDGLEERAACVYNDVPTVRWNMTKTYLRDLAAAGIPTPPTVWVPRGSRTTLRQVAASVAWTSLVVKPTVSASAHRTWRVDRAGGRAPERRFARLVATCDVMVQPFLPVILTEGELSFVFLAGHFSHAVCKRPRPGDFRVQEHFGGTAHRVGVDDRLVARAAAALAAVPGQPLYARVDGVVVTGDFVLTELELVEPSLFFALDVTAAARLAAEIDRATRAGSRAPAR